MHILLCQVRWTENSQTKIVEQSDNNSILVHSSSPKRLILQTIPKQDRASFITIAEKITSLWKSRLQVKNSLIPTAKVNYHNSARIQRLLRPDWRGPNLDRSRRGRDLRDEQRHQVLTNLQRWWLSVRRGPGRVSFLFQKFRSNSCFADFASAPTSTRPLYIRNQLQSRKDL